MVAATGLSGVMAILLLCLYIWRNRTASLNTADDGKDEFVDEDERTDFDIPGFRYVY